MILVMKLRGCFRSSEMGIRTRSVRTLSYAYAFGAGIKRIAVVWIAG